MSNSRIFCVAWASWNALSLFAMIAGFPGKYTGVDGMIAQLIVGITVGVAAIAAFGDRKAKP